MTPLNLMNEYPAVQAEWKDFKVLFFWSDSPVQLYTVNQPVSTLEDMAGLRLDIEAPFSGYLDALGAVPVNIKQESFASAVEQGTVDGGLCQDKQILGGKKIGKLCPYRTGS
jgi:TRAP-type C4-dicarboxylate transport system substrate-binding protein